MALIRKEEPVVPVRVTELCECVPEGSPLNYTGSVPATMGHQARYIYTCSRCHVVYYLAEKATRVEFKNI